MRKLLLLFLTGLLVFGTACDNPTESKSNQQERRVDWPSLCDSPWPIWGGDPQHTFRSPYSGPAKCDTALIYRNTSGYFNTGPLIGPDDDIYIFSSFDETYLGTAGYKGAVVKKLTADGTVVWQTLVSTEAATVFIEPVLTSQNNLIIACDDGTLSKVLADGTIEYRYSDQAGPGASWGLNLDKTGNIYLSIDSDEIASFDPDCNLRWKKKKLGESWQLGPISPSGNLIYTGFFGENHFTDPETLLAINTSGETVLNSTIASCYLSSINNDGELITYSPADSSIVCLNSNGKLIWKKQIIIDNIHFEHTYNNIAIGPEGEIITFLFVVGNNYALSLNKDGDINWTLPLTTVEPSMSVRTSCSIIDKDGNLYCSIMGTVFSLDACGNIRWTIQMWDPSMGGLDDWLAINSKGEIIYCISRLYNNLVYKIY